MAINNIKKEIQRIEASLIKPEIYNDYKKAGELQKELEQLKTDLEFQNKIKTIKDQLQKTQREINLEMQKKTPDKNLLHLLKEESRSLKTQIKDTEKEKTTSGPNNIINKIIVEIRAAAGGDEASIFAGNLFRMYNHYAESQNWKTILINHSKNSLGASKEICFEITGNNCYQKLKGETGVHRVQRIPVTEKKGRIHTSTVTVAVLPIKDSSKIEINPSDLKIDFYRAGGAGGQHVNKTCSAVRITHIPSGIMVTSQNQRSQHQNKDKAMQILQAQLEEKKQNEEDAKIASNRRAQIGKGDRSEKIKTYNYPQDRLTDHRMKKNYFGLEKYLNGNIDKILTDYLTFSLQKD